MSVFLQKLVAKMPKLVIALVKPVWKLNRMVGIAFVALHQKQRAFLDTRKEKMVNRSLMRSGAAIILGTTKVGLESTKMELSLAGGFRVLF